MKVNKEPEKVQILNSSYPTMLFLMTYEQRISVDYSFLMAVITTTVSVYLFAIFLSQPRHTHTLGEQSAYCTAGSVSAT